MKIILTISLFVACSLSAFAQTADTRTTGEAASQSSLSAAKKGEAIEVASGTRLVTELQNTIDVRKMAIGDEVILRTTQAIKSQGRTVVHKGARLIGHVTQIGQRTKDNADSHVTILFDRLEHGSLSTPISATITSITNAGLRASANNDDVFATNATGRGTTATSSSSGGLLGVGSVVNSTTSTVGGVVGGATSAVGSTVNATTNATGTTAAGVGKSLGRIQISESTNASVSGGSTLSLRGENLKLEKGTTFNLVVNQSASAAAGPNE